MHAVNTALLFFLQVDITNVSYMSFSSSTLIPCSFDYSLSNDNGGNLPAKTEKGVNLKV